MDAEVRTASRIGAAPAVPLASARSTLREYGRVLATALAVALLLRCFVLQAFKIPSGSMLPTLQVGDHLLISKLQYGLRLPLLGGWLLRYGAPAPGDVVVFTHPTDRAKTFIKRVVAVAGEEIEVRDKVVLVDGARRDVPQAYVAAGPAANRLAAPRDDYGPVLVPAGRLFVMGDNRDHSYDSRSWGFVDVDDVQGKAVVVYWSWDGRERWVRWERLGTVIR